SASGVGRSTDDLYLAFRRLHSTDLQTIGIGMRVGADDPCNCEGTKLCSTILNTLDFEAEHGKAFDNLLQGGLSFEVVLQPAQRELHGVTVPAPSRVLPAAESRSASASGYHFRRRALDRAFRISASQCARFPCRRQNPGSGGNRCRNSQGPSDAPCRSPGSPANPCRVQ